MLHTEDHILISEDLKNKIFWYSKHPNGITTNTDNLTLNYYFKVSNNNKETEKFQTFNDFSIDDIQDAIEIIHLVENELKSKNQIKAELVNNIESYDKEIFLLLKLKEDC